MRFKRLFALLCAVSYIMTASAVAAGQTAAVSEQTAPAAAVLATEQPAARAAALKVVASTHKVQINGQPVSPQAYNIGGYNYFKLRDVAYMLRGTASAFDVTWNGTQNAVNIISGAAYTAVGGEMTTSAADTLRVQQSTAKVLLDGSGISIQGYNINGNNYYKIADVSSALGFTAAFESATRTVQITTPAETPELPVIEPDVPEQDTPAPPASGQEFVAGVYRVTVETTLSIRSGPGLTYPIIGRLSNGDEIVVDNLSDGWARILDEAGSTERYCSADYLTRVRDYDGAGEAEPPGGLFVPGVYRVTVDTWLSVRSGAGTSYPIIGRLSNGDEIVVDSLSDGWAHLLDTAEGTGRYCSADYLTRVRDYESGEGEPEDPVIPPRTSHLDGVMTVIIDAGHGGSDIGAHNADMTLDEKHINLYVAQYLKRYLESEGVTVIMVRDTLEQGSSLSLRGQVMEQHAASADLFFSIHHNAANTIARGAEALAQIADRNGGPSRLLAEALLEEYEKLGVPIRSVVFREGSNGDYYYTNRAAAALSIPALTSEFCFIDNEQDQQFIDSDEDLQAEAHAQFNAIMYYFTQVEY